MLTHLRNNGPSTQADIARATSLSRATVNNIVQTLRDENKVEYQWRNRREALVTLVSTRGSIMVVTVQERRAVGNLFDFSHQRRWVVSTDDLAAHRDRQTSPAIVLDLARRLSAKGRADAVAPGGLAIAIEGPIERATSAMAPWAWHRLPEWKGVNIDQFFTRALRLPLIFDNDANLAALAEWSWGEGRGHDHFLQISCSAGVGGGIIIKGDIYHGGTGLAGEIGHMPIDDAGDLCFCGGRGCLSTFATERAILNALRSSELARHSLVEVVESARQGDAACQRVLFEAGLHIGRAMATVVRVMAPGMISIGGTLAAAGDIVLDGLTSAAEIINLRQIGQPPRFCLASIREDAVEFGAVAALLSRLDLGVSNLAPWMLQPIRLDTDNIPAAA